jgi:magnesium-protoporphyrin O-methyltransferase
VAGQLVDIGRSRAPAGLVIDWRVGDMLDPALGRFDHVVAMDSLIHYEHPQLIAALRGLRARADASVLFTFAPATPILRTMHAVGTLFPRRDRAPAIVPVAPGRIAADLSPARTARVSSGFYTSQAVELRG